MAAGQPQGSFRRGGPKRHVLVGINSLTGPPVELATLSLRVSSVQEGSGTPRSGAISMLIEVWSRTAGSLFSALM
jgi:hypothetical protein